MAKILEILINGIPWTFKELEAARGKDAAQLIWDEELPKTQERINRKNIRRKIKADIGDTDSIQGTLSDVTQLTAAALLALVVSYKEGDTYAKQRAAFMSTLESLVPATEDGKDVYAHSEDFLSGIQSGDIILTAALKGLPGVLAEMASRSTGAAHILIAATTEAQ